MSMKIIKYVHTKDPLYKFRRFSMKELKNIFYEEEIIDADISDLVNMGKGFAGRPVFPKFLRNAFNEVKLFRKLYFAEIIYIVVKLGDFKNKEDRRKEIRKQLLNNKGGR